MTFILQYYPALRSRVTRAAGGAYRVGMTGPHLDTPLVSTQWLADHLGSDDLLVFDATVLPYTQPTGRGGFLSGHESYVINGHLPGAVFADLMEDLSDTESPLPFTHQSPEVFATAVGELGVDNETTVVVYDTGVGQWAARLWWLFRANGYDRVAVLDGGYTKWTAEGRETDVGHVAPTPRTFRSRERPDSWVTKSDIEQILAGTEPGALVCGIPPKQFSGAEGKGHIPGSVSVPAGRLVERGSHAFLTVDALRETFASVLGAERIVTYCNGGIAAAADALALTLLGHTNVALYDGSLAEWTKDPHAPLSTAA